MYAKEWLPFAISIGINHHDFWHLTMRELNAYIEGYKIKMRTADVLNHQLGMYIKLAVSISLDEGFNGKKAKSKYPEKPLFSEEIEIDETEYELTEERKQKLLDDFVLKRRIAKANWDIANEGQ